MASSSSRDRLVVDSIHGDIHLTPLEWAVVDTGSFQRLRHIKQIGMGHFTYPNATHTRFAHSLGVLGIMIRVLDAAKHSGLDLDDEERKNLRLAALLHDIGHYPYSHVMESIHSVVLAEELLDRGTGPKEAFDATAAYPSHEDLGRLIVTSQQDLVDAIGGQDRAKAVCDIFTRDNAADSQMSKLIHSNLDMDRLDYLLRDSDAAGVPYGIIDIHYILNAIKVSPTGMVGVTKKALPAAEQFLVARHFMHRAVYYHKTTVAFEAACQHLLRRLRDRPGENYDVPKTGAEIEEKAKSTELVLFTDAFVDQIVIRAIEDSDPVVKALACAIHRRRPPKLLKEVAGWQGEGEYESRRSAFVANCKARLTKLAEKHGLPLGLFLYWTAKPIRFEERAAKVTAEEARNLPSEAQEESIKVFVDESPDAEPKSIMDIKYSMMSWCASKLYNITRLYFVRSPEEPDAEDVTEALRNAVKEWDRPE